MPDETEKQSRRLAALDALRSDGRGVRADPSSLRLYVRDNFASLIAARKRDVSWQQITDVMVAAGVRSPDGSDLTWRKVAVFFHTERYGKEKKRERKTGARAASRQRDASVPTPVPEQPAQAAPTAPPPPTAKGAFSTGDPVLDRALNRVGTLKPLPPMGNMDTQGRRSPKPAKEQQDDGDENG